MYRNSDSCMKLFFALFVKAFSNYIAPGQKPDFSEFSAG